MPPSKEFTDRVRRRALALAKNGHLCWWNLVLRANVHHNTARQWIRRLAREGLIEPAGRAEPPPNGGVGQQLWRTMDPHGTQRR